MAEIRVIDHCPQLLPTGDHGYRDLVQQTLVQFEDEPWFWMVKACFKNPAWGLPDDDHDGIRRSFKLVKERPVNEVVRRTLDRLTADIPPPVASIECHLYPAYKPNRAGGASFAPGKMLIGVPLTDDWQLRIQRACAHEYSHTVRMALWPQDEGHGYGAARDYSVRDYLIFEGLAEALAAALYPSEAQSTLKGVSREQIVRYRELIEPHLDESGWNAYIRYILCDALEDIPMRVGYAAALTLVTGILDEKGLSAVEAQRLPYEAFFEEDEMWEGSGQ